MLEEVLEVQLGRVHGTGIGEQAPGEREVGGIVMCCAMQGNATSHSRILLCGRQYSLPGVSSRLRVL